MRRLKRKRNYTKFLIISTVCVFLFMGIGYSYLQQTLNVNMSLSKKDQVIDITDNVVSSGDGLYEDQYEDGRYIYRGSEPNNYILFNDELWRIMAKEIDGTYKIIRDEMIGKMAYDSIGYRTPENNTFCSDVLSGCSPFGKVNGDFILGSYDRGTVTEDSEIAQYLNHEYYDTLSEISKSQMQLHDFKIGGIVLNEDEYSGDLLFEIYSEADYKWAGNVGLINLTDYLRASISPSCEHTTYDYRVPNSCTSNYLIDSLENTQYWTLTPFVFVDGIAGSSVYVISSYEGEKHATTNIVEDSETTYVRPVVFLKSSIQFTGGNGTKGNPYVIG